MDDTVSDLIQRHLLSHCRDRKMLVLLQSRLVTSPYNSGMRTYLFQGGGGGCGGTSLTKHENSIRPLII